VATTLLRTSNYGLLTDYIGFRHNSLPFSKRRHFRTSLEGENLHAQKIPDPHDGPGLRRSDVGYWAAERKKSRPKRGSLPMAVSTENAIRGRDGRQRGLDLR
jgi:hypothetical protein